jgi:hypothetical protein
LPLTAGGESNERQGDSMAESGATKPYLVTSAVFLAVAALGVWRLYWGESQFAFLLLLYFIVILGIRLDELNKQLKLTNQLLMRYLKRDQARPPTADSAPPADQPPTGAD